MDTNTATPATSPHLFIDPDDRVMTLPEHCEAARISPATERRLRNAGKGVRITHLSDHRIGVTVRDHRAWLASRSGS
jgi:hypothetical protein